LTDIRDRLRSSAAITLSVLDSETSKHDTTKGKGGQTSRVRLVRERKEITRSKRKSERKKAVKAVRKLNICLGAAATAVSSLLSREGGRSESPTRMIRCSKRY
jgi:hypothetical protein